MTRDPAISMTDSDSDSIQSLLETIRSSVSHLRPVTSAKFLNQAESKISALMANDNAPLIFSKTAMVCNINWALVLPFLAASEILPGQLNLISKWAHMTSLLSAYDLDGALTFLKQTPKAVQHLNTKEDLVLWGRQALDAFDASRNKKKMRRPVNAYLIESIHDNCNYPLDRWSFFLEQAGRISALSVDAAEGFIQHGNQACLLLSDKEITQWVKRGLEECPSESERINYFKGTSLKAVESSDLLADGVALKDKKNIISIICEAFLGHPVQIRSNSQLLGRKGFTGGAATDGLCIFLPNMVSDFSHFKLMALHQAMLLDKDRHTEIDADHGSDPFQIHQDADDRLIRKLPGLRSEMARCLDQHAQRRSSDEKNNTLPDAKPWWGDIIPGLIEETDQTIATVKEMAVEEHEDIPEEILDALVASILSTGERQPDALWKMLGEMLENIEFESPDAEALEESVKTFFYKEWDNQISDYKLEWCQVRQRIAREDPNDFVINVNERLRGIIRLIRKQFMKLKPETFRKYKAQPIGDALDIDALVQAYTDMKSGRTMTENVYIRRDKRVRDVSVFFLVDLSGSTEEAVNGRKVIDIQKEAMAIMADALQTLDDAYAIYGFSTEGRFRVDMFKVKGFSEAYDETCQYRLGNLQPKGLTRMGTVIRHSIYKLDQVSSAIKLLIILTDGRPYDLEYGNLDYAISDTKKAIQEARNNQIHPFIITSDQKGSDYLEMISPQTECIILPKVELLPTLLPALYRRLTG